MPKRKDLKKILVIGSGPIVIGQGAEFDYAGTQACLALREEGYTVVLCNSNPATIMTDNAVADKIYMEPLTADYIAEIIEKERPDAILPGIGGQTGLNLAMALNRSGVLKKYGCELLGTSAESIEKAEDREKFKTLCREIGEPVLPSEVADSIDSGVLITEKIGYPVVLRPAFTLGGSGGGFANNEEELRSIMATALDLSPIRQVLVEKSVKGFKEIEYEVIRDKTGTAITVCNMENIDPVGIHTGDSIVVCPTQTLTDKENQMLRDSALNIIRALKIEGGCNVQFALDAKSDDYFVIEVNPRVSRSSALASKASGYPIARVSAKIGVGMTLDEIPLANTPAAFEPSLDYVVTKIPRFPFDKFATADETLSTQMKATGETMAIGRTFEESFLKGIRSSETGANHIYSVKFTDKKLDFLADYIKQGSDDRIYAIAELLRRDYPVENICAITSIDKFFIDKIAKIVTLEKELKEKPLCDELLRKLKKSGFSDAFIAQVKGVTEEEIFALRHREKILPVYKMIDTCASEFCSYVPYFYSSFEDENETVRTDKKKIVVLGSGPVRIGQGIEFDYSTVHAVKTIKSFGYEAIIINNNPETVSTDYTVADKLYFEPLTVEDVLSVIETEKPDGVIVSLGGQTAVNLAEPLNSRGVKIIGTDCAAIEKAENRNAFEKLLEDLNIPEPKGVAVTSVKDGLSVAGKIGYPLLVRPSFVLGGRAMQIVAKEKDLEKMLKDAFEKSEGKPVLMDKYVFGREVEVDAVCDGKDVFVPGIMELVERTGVHSGDSISVYPSFSLSKKVKETILEYTRKMGIAIGIVGLFNVQFIVDKEENVFVIEVNPRSSRTVPFLSKATGYALADIATLVILGKSLKEQGFTEIYPQEKDACFVKVPAFSFSKIKGADAYLSPEMKSTGEAIGIDKEIHRAMKKAMVAAGMSFKKSGTVIVSVADEDKEEVAPLIKRFYDLGFKIEATTLTGEVLKAHGIPNTVRHKPSEGSDEILTAIKSGGVSYVINTRAILSGVHYIDGAAIRACAVSQGITMMTSLDTVRILLDVIEDESVSD